MSTAITIQESVIAGGRVDEDAGVIYGAKLLGPESANGRRYSRAALQDAARLYLHKKICLDHDRNNPKRERGVLEEVATINRTWENESGVYGDVHFFKKHSAYPYLIDRAKTAPKSFGFSHNADGQQSRDGRLIESLSNVRSVDIVGNPATTNGIFESREHRQSFAEKCRAGTIFESDTPERGTVGADVANQSREVDSAVAAALNELLPSGNLRILRTDGAKSIGRAFETLVVLLAKDKDGTASKKNVAIAAANVAKEEAIDAFQKIIDKFSGGPPPDNAVDTMESRNPFTPRHTPSGSIPTDGKAFSRLCQ